VAKHHAIAARFDAPLDATDKELVVQYEVRLQKTLDCGGAYLKLLTAESMPKNLEDFENETPYTIMFGPDKCGLDSMVHFIFRHQNPISKVYEEKHMTERPKIKTDKLTHLYTLHVLPDDSFKVYIDQEQVREGSLLKDFEPQVNPPKEIDDPDDKKPSDWVDEPEMPELGAKKPEDWDESAPQEIEDPDAKKPATWLDDEPLLIPDPNSKKPEDWDEQFDGEWEAPTVPNPKCEEFGCGEWKPPTIKNPAFKGKWKPPVVPNPNYKGEWEARQIPNPNYFEDEHPSNFKAMGGVGFELWTMTDSIMFDNLIITHDKKVADEYAEKTWRVKHNEEKRKDDEQKATEAESGEGFLDRLGESFGQFLDYATKNPLIIGGTALIGVLPIILVCFFRTKKPVHHEEISETTTKTDKKEKGETKKKEHKEEKSEEEKTEKSPEKRKKKKTSKD